MNDGFIKVGAASPVLKVADPAFNCDKIIEMMKSASAKGVKLLVFPELSVTGYTAQDLFFQNSLQPTGPRGRRQPERLPASLDVS